MGSIAEGYKSFSCNAVCISIHVLIAVEFFHVSPAGATEAELPTYVRTILGRLGMKKLPKMRTRLLYGPVPVAKVLRQDWEPNPNLSEEGGVQLLHAKLVCPAPSPDPEPDSDHYYDPDYHPDSNPAAQPHAEREAEDEIEPEAELDAEAAWEVRKLEPILHGPRVAPKATYVLRAMYGRDAAEAADRLREKLRFALDCDDRDPYLDDDLLERMVDGDS